MSDVLFSLLNPVDGSLLYHRNDVNDPRLGELVKTNPQNYSQAKTVIVGCPQDEGVRRNKGRLGAAHAPDAIRAALYKMAIAGLDVDKISLFDLGNTIIKETLEATHQSHLEIVQQIIASGKNLIVLGGGNDISYPDVKALSFEVSPLLAMNIDAHFDVRADKLPNSGTPYRQLLEENTIPPNNFYEIGYQWFGNSPQYLDYLQSKGVHTISFDEISRVGVVNTFEKILQSHHDVQGIFWGFDLDVVHGSDAPGVSALNPLGISGAELCQIAQLAGRDPRTRLVEFTEVNPNYDIDGRTCRLTAAAIYYYLLGITRKDT